MNAAPHTRGHAPASTLEQVIWQLWVWLAWLVPVFALVLRFLTPQAGWETLILAVAVPVWVPIVAVLIMVPRWIWRSRAGREVEPPALVTAAGVAHWGGLLMISFAMRGTGDTSSNSSILLDSVPALGEGGETLVLIAATLLSGAALLTAIAAAMFMRVDRARGPRGWVPVTVALLLPWLLVAGAVLVPDRVLPESSWAADRATAGLARH